MMSTTATITRATILFLFVAAIVGMTNAFAPIIRPATSASASSALQLGFLKDLGLEKPSWLPDFGGKKKEEKAPAPASEVANEEDGEAPAEETSEE